MLPPMKPFGKSGGTPLSNNTTPTTTSSNETQPAAAITPSSSSGFSSKTWDFSRPSSQQQPQQQANLHTAPSNFNAQAPSFPSSLLNRKFDFASPPPPSSGDRQSAPHLQAPRTNLLPTPNHASSLSKPWTSKPSSPSASASAAVTNQDSGNGLIKRPKFSPETQKPVSSSLVVSAKPTTTTAVATTYEEPFLEVSNVIQTQTRKIKELETQLREQIFLNEQMREKLEEAAETNKLSNRATSELTQQLARAEKTAEHKDKDAAELRTQISSLEKDRAHMLSENVSLSKSIQEEKRQFAQELKRSNDVILILQGIRNTTTMNGQAVALEMTDETKNARSRKEDEEEGLLRMKELEKQLDETEGALQHYDQCYQVVLQIVDQCPTCSVSVAQLQNEQAIGASNGGEEDKNNTQQQQQHDAAKPVCDDGERMEEATVA